MNERIGLKVLAVAAVLSFISIVLSALDFASSYSLYRESIFSDGYETVTFLYGYWVLTLLIDLILMFSLSWFLLRKNFSGSRKIVIFSVVLFLIYYPLDFIIWLWQETDKGFYNCLDFIGNYIFGISLRNNDFPYIDYSTFKVFLTNITFMLFLLFIFKSRFRRGEEAGSW